MRPHAEPKHTRQGSLTQLRFSGIKMCVWSGFFLIFDELESAERALDLAVRAVSIPRIHQF